MSFEVRLIGRKVGSEEQGMEREMRPAYGGVFMKGLLEGD